MDTVAVAAPLAVAPSTEVGEPGVAGGVVVATDPELGCRGPKPHANPSLGCSCCCATVTSTCSCCGFCLRCRPALARAAADAGWQAAAL